MANPSTYKAVVWKFLSNGLQHNFYRVLEREGVIYSVTCSADPSVTLHYGKALSTGWNFTPEIIQEEENKHVRADSDIPLYRAEDLSGFTMVQLKALCLKYNVRASGVKLNYCNALLRRSQNLNRTRSRAQSLTEANETAGFPGVGPVNMLYKECFNGVDLIDRYHGQVKEFHGNNHWKPRFLYNILRTEMICSWIFAQNYEYYYWFDYREQMIDLMFSH